MQVRGDMRGCFDFFISIPIMFLMYCYGLITSKTEPWIVRQAMTRKGRMMNADDLEKLAASKGTLIFEHNSLTYRIWWTDDDILALLPMEYPPEEWDFDDDIKFDETMKARKPFDIWMYDNYTNLDTGKAKLIEIDNVIESDGSWNTTLRSTYPNLNCVETYDFLPDFDDMN